MRCLREVLVTEKMARLLEKRAQAWPCPWSCPSHAEPSVIRDGRRRASPGVSVEAEVYLLLALLFLLFLFRTATIEDPASHFPDISSETLCWPAEPYGSILPLRIASGRSLFPQDEVGEWKASREEREASPVPGRLQAPGQP